MSIPRRIRDTRSIALCAALLLLASAILRAAAGDVDPSFVPNIGAPVAASVLQPDGKMVIGGTFTTVGGTSRIILARLNADGTNDPTFTSPFEDNIANGVSSLALQTDGAILVGGIFKTPAGFKTLVRVTQGGLLDPTFAAPTIFQSVAKVAVRASDGRIFVADAGNPGVSLLNPDGSFVRGIGTNLDRVTEFVVQLDGKVVMAGTAANSLYYLMRFVLNVATDSYEFDSTFNNGAPINVDDRGIHAMALLGDGRILVGGGFLSIDGNSARSHLVRLLATGAIDPSFDAGAMIGLGVQDLAVQSDGKIVAGGYFRTPGESTNHGFARFEVDGAVDTTFSVDLPDRNTTEFVWSVNVQPDGRILIAGDFTNIGPTARTFMARLLGDGSGSNASPVLSNVAATSPISEHGITTLSGTISDADAGDTFTLTVNWGDGFAAQVLTYPAGTTTFSVQRQYNDDNPTGTSSDVYGITLTLGDSGGGSDTDTASVTVNNLAPSLSGIAAAPPTLTVGGTTTVSGTVTDTGTLDPHSVTIAWGDGSANTTIPIAAGVTTFGSTHQYNASGAFTVGVTAADDDLGSTNGGTSVTVNPVGVIPTAPTSLTATAVSKSQINLAWTDRANNESGFAIERCIPKGKTCTFLLLTQTGANAATFANTGLAANKEYRYRVRAFNGTGSSAYTNVATANTPKK